MSSICVGRVAVPFRGYEYDAGAHPRVILTAKWRAAECRRAQTRSRSVKNMAATLTPVLGETRV
jgi:hypothetical protein